MSTTLKATSEDLYRRGRLWPQAGQAMAKKRKRLLCGGTLVVWDVDLLGTDVVSVCRGDEPGKPTIYRCGDIAEAEPAVPNWSMAVDQFCGEGY